LFPDRVLQLLELTQLAHLKAAEILQTLQTALLEDEKNRASGYR
jgi:hypothetical protein